MPSGGIDQAFRSGELLLRTVPSADCTPAVPEDGSLVAVVYVGVFVVLGIILLRNCMQLFPLLADSIFRARGSSSLENSVRASSDRNRMSALFLIPMVLIVWYYRLYDADFLRGLSSDGRLLAITAVVLSWLLLRLLFYYLLKPRRPDSYMLSRRVAYTFWILLSLLVFLCVGVLSVAGCPYAVIRRIIYGLLAFGYFLFLIRKVQILALSYTPLQTFLYLCGLEILPTAALVISAVIF